MATTALEYSLAGTLKKHISVDGMETMHKQVNDEKVKLVEASLGTSACFPNEDIVEHLIT